MKHFIRWLGNTFRKGLPEPDHTRVIKVPRVYMRLPNSRIPRTFWEGTWLTK